MSSSHQNLEEQPMTVGTVIKWGGIMVSVVSAIVTVVWFAASLRADIASIRQDVKASHDETTLRDQQQDKEIDALKNRAETTDKSLTDVERKLDVAVAILERLEKRMGPTP